MKIVIYPCTPAREQVSLGYARAMNVLYYQGGHLEANGVELRASILEGSANLARTRNRMVEQVLEQTANDDAGTRSVLLFVDSDQAARPDTFLTLALNAARMDMVCGLPVPFKIPGNRNWNVTPSEPAVLRFAPPPFGDKQVRYLEVDEIGTGVMAIPVSLLREFKEKFGPKWFVMSDELSEDFYFCRKLRSLDHTVLALLDHPVEHYGQVAFDGDFGRLYPQGE